MSDEIDAAVVEPYILRLLDECREEIKISDSKASILFAGVAFAMALLANPLIDEDSALRTHGVAVLVLSIAAVVALGCSMWLLGLAVLPRLGNPEQGQARYFEEQARFSDHESLLAVVAENARFSPGRHAQQLLVLSRIARRKYQHLRRAMYAVCIAVGILAVDALVAAVS